MTEKMKPSGIAWIGDLPSEWNTTKVRFVTKVRSEKGYYCAEDKYIGLENISSYTGKYIPAETEYDPGLYDIYREGDVLFSKLRPYLAKALIADDTGFCTGELEVICEYQGDKRFLFYYLLSDGFLKMVDASTYGTKMPRANWDYIKNLQIPVISNQEQRAIADFLDAQCAKIDSVIADIEKQIETLQKYKKSLITEAVTKGLDRSVPMKDSRVDWIGEIPSAWEAKRMKYFLSVASGDAITSDQLEDGDYPVFGGGKQMGWSNKHNIPGDTILIGRVGANCGCVSITPKESWATDNALIVSTNSYVKYVYYILVAADLNKLNDANAQPLITGAKVGNCVVPYTYKYEEQKLIADYLDSACSKIDEVLALKQQQLAKMQQHKKSLIYEYVTGKKRVTEVN